VFLYFIQCTSPPVYQHFGGCPGDLKMFGFLFFTIFVIQLSFFLLVLLHLLTGVCSVFYSVYLSSCDVDVQLSHQYFGGRSNSLKVFDFPFFEIFISRLLSILFIRSRRARLLILAPLMIFWIHLADGLRTLRCEFYQCLPVMNLFVNFSLIINLNYMVNRETKQVETVEKLSQVLPIFQ